MISIDRVFHTSANLHWMFVVIVFIHNLQNRKSYIAIGCYLGEIPQSMRFTISAKLHMLKITRQTQLKTLVEKNFIGSRKSLKNIVTLIQFVIFNPLKVPWGWIAFHWNSFVISPGLMTDKTGALANEAYFSNPNVSLKQYL